MSFLTNNAISYMYTAQLYDLRWEQQLISMAAMNINNQKNSYQQLGQNIQPGTAQYVQYQEILRNIMLTEKALMLRQKQLQDTIQMVDAAQKSTEEVAKKSMERSMSFFA
jgi:hypothetical protein